MPSATELARLRSEVGDLVARHEKRRDAAEFTRYAGDPRGFFRDVLHCAPLDLQIDIAEAVRDHPRVVCVSAQGMGKDWLTARLALWWAYARQGFVVLTSATLRQAKEITMRELRRAYAGAPDLPGELFSMELRIDAAGEQGILAFTSDNSDKLLGFHHPRLLICMSEAQAVEDGAWEAAQSCATAPENRIFAYGNPTRPVGGFVRAAESDAWHTITLPADVHPNVRTGRMEVPGAISAEWVAGMRAEYGEASAFFQSRVMARFPTESVEGLVKREWLRAAFDRYDSGALDDALYRVRRPVMSLDVARYGVDHTVLAPIFGPIVRELVTWHHASLTDSGDRLIKEAEARWLNRQLPPPRLVIDGAGLGAGCVDYCRRKGWDVEEFNGSMQAAEPTRHLNLRASAFWRFRELLENGKVAIARDAMLEEEALAIEWTIAPKGQIQIVSKDLVRAAIGRSCDRLDAVVQGLGHSMGGIGYVFRQYSYVA